MFTTIITPATAISRIIASGYNPLQFISRAYRDHSYEWAKTFEILAHINNCFGMDMTGEEAYNCMSEEVEMDLAMYVVNQDESICEENYVWYLQFCNAYNKEYMPLAVSNAELSFFQHKLNQGDIIGAIDVAILEADNTKAIAQAAIKDIDDRTNQLTALADAALSKYTLL